MSNTQLKSPGKYESNPFKVIFDGFNNLFKYNQTMSIIILVFSLLSAFGQVFDPSLWGGSSSPSSTSTAGEPSGEAVAIIAAVVASVLLFLLPVIIFISTMWSGFVTYVALKTSQGKTVEFGEAVSATWKKFWTILWTNTVVFFKILGGLILFIVPGIRASLRYNMVLFPIFDENANAKQAIARSKQLTNNHLVEVMGMVVASSLIPFVSQLMTIGGQSVMYPQLKHLKDTGGEKPKVHWANYLIFILFGAFFLFFLFIGLLVALIASR